MSTSEETLPENIFDKNISRQQIKSVFERGAKSTKVWDFGSYRKMGQSFPELRSGLCYIVAPENWGKSILQLNIARQLVTANSNCYWLDFSLDDSLHQRYGYIIAGYLNKPISYILSAGSLTEEESTARKELFINFAKDWAPRYRPYASDLDPTGVPVYVPRTVQEISEILYKARKELGAEPLILCTIDGFHDLVYAGRANDENERQRNKSMILKTTAHETNTLLIATAQARKGSRAHNVDADILKFDNAALFDAVVVLTLYSDVAANKSNAEIFWIKDKDYVQLPVFEVTVQKNKVGSFRGSIFYVALPEHAAVKECEPEDQDYYQELVFPSSKRN